MVQRALLALAVAGGALQGCAGMMAKPEVVTAGCGDSFVRVGNFFTGGYFVGPEGRSFCQRGSEMHFMVSGQCTGEAISCRVRAPQRAGDTRSAPRKHEELQLSSRPTFPQKQQALRKSMAVIKNDDDIKSRQPIPLWGDPLQGQPAAGQADQPGADAQAQRHQDVRHQPGGGL
jgi:hypothetical protein